MNTRNYEIDGIRGWAALFVALFHFFQETFGVLYPVLHEQMFSFVFDAHLMVIIFFVLSGDALSSSFFKTSKNTRTIRIALARYFRLTFLIAVSCGISYVLMKLQLNKNIEAASLVHREDWLGGFLNFEQSLSGAIRYMFHDVYFNHGVGKSYNPFLWTMSIELSGSVLVFINILVLSALSSRRQIEVLVGEFGFFCLFGNYLALFPLGMILGWLRHKGFFVRIQTVKYNILILFLFLAIAFWFFPFYKQALFRVADVITLHRISSKSYLFVYAGFLVFLMYSSRQLVVFLSSGVSRFLGSISFPLYVLQFNILVSFTSFCILHISAKGLLGSPIVFIIPALSVALSIAVAFGFNQIESRYLRSVNHLINNKVMKS